MCEKSEFFKFKLYANYANLKDEKKREKRKMQIHLKWSTYYLLKLAVQSVGIYK